MTLGGDLAVLEILEIAREESHQPPRRARRRRARKPAQSSRARATLAGAADGAAYPFPPQARWPQGKAPARKNAGAPLFFCVQKHLASHLHYDLRLEWNGVLLSWAVPRGPSIDSRNTRLAMHVEDHPLEYGTFEGVIPDGYGAGIVMLWDEGTWEPEVDDVEAALMKGDLKFRLNGYKLKGSWVLVKTRGFSPSTGSGQAASNSWLLIKHRDDWSGPLDITEFAPLSVKTPDADFAEILSEGTPDLWTRNPPAKTGDTGKMFQAIIARALEMRNTKGAKATKKPKA